MIPYILFHFYIHLGKFLIKIVLIGNSNSLSLFLSSTNPKNILSKSDFLKWFNEISEIFYSKIEANEKVSGVLDFIDSEGEFRV